MPPVLLLIRHAQALHNIEKRHHLHDPDLSEVGFGQLPALRENLMNHPLAQNAGLVLTSPMRRTIQTALGSVDWLLAKGIRLQADADWQENSDKPCDTGTPVTALGAEFPIVDFTSLDVVYPDKSTPAGAKYAFNKRALLARGQSALKALYDRPEKVIIVVSHSAFLRMCVTGSWFYNSDYRIFEFEPLVEGNLDGEYKLREADETREKGGGMGLSFKRTTVIGSELTDEEHSK